MSTSAKYIYNLKFILLQTGQDRRRIRGTRNPRATHRPHKHNRKQCKQTFSYCFTTFFLIIQTIPAHTGKTQGATFYAATAATLRRRA